MVLSGDSIDIDMEVVQTAEPFAVFGFIIKRCTTAAE
jgi:hypothetical protein